MRLDACLWATLWSLLLAIAPAQQPAPNTVAVFGGLVRDSVTGQPIKGATVRLNPVAHNPAYAATTGPAGEFRFESVEPGAYRINVSRIGYAATHSAVLNDGHGSPTLSFAAGRSVTGVSVRLDPHATVTGRVTNAEGEPLGNAWVRALAEQWQRGFRTYQIQSSASTDDRGEYRLDVDPGRYYISSAPAYSSVVPSLAAEAPGKPEMRTVTLFHPGARVLSEAEPMDVRPGQQIAGIDFKLPELPTSHVRGTVKPYPSDVIMAFVTLHGRHGDTFGAGSSAQVKKNGSFDVAGVVPDSYWLEMYPPVSGRRPTGRIAIDVIGRDVNGVTVPGVMPFALTGHARMEDGSSLPPGFSLQLEMLDWYGFKPFPQFSRDPGGGFKFQNLISGEWVLTAPPTGDFYIRSISYNQHETPNGKLDLILGAAGDVEVMLGAGTGQIDGTVHWPDAATGGSPPLSTGEPAAVLVSQTGVTGNTGARSADIDQSGKFQFQFVPPGKYFVFVAAGIDAGLWQNREFVDLVAARGSAVELAQRGSVAVTVEILAESDVRRAIERLPR